MKRSAVPPEIEGVTANAIESTTRRDAWEGFPRGPWAERVDVRDVVQRTYYADLPSQRTPSGTGCPN
jgi:hypothetical protein